MFNDVYDYYGKVVNDIHATEILKTCFYLKVDPKLSVQEGKNGAEQGGEKASKMREFVKKWNWLSSGVERMDNFENWDINAVNNLWNNTKKFILKGYRDILGNIETRKISHRFSDEELKGISRKIYSHFAVSDNKIDNSLAFKTYPPEKLLTIEFNRTKEGREVWTLAKRAIVRDSPVKIIIHSERSLIAMIVWIGMNRLYQKDYTRMEIATGFHPVDPNFLRDLVIDISTHFSFKKLDIHSGYFLRDPFPVISYIIINPYTKYAKRVEEIIFLCHNSWGETKFERFENFNDIAHLLGRVLSGGLSTDMPFDSALRLTSSYPYRASTEFDRLQNIAKDMYGFLVEHKTGKRKRYVTMMQNTYFVYSTRRFGGGEEMLCKPYDSEVKLLYALSYNTGVESSLHIDKTVPELTYLRIIEENFRDDRIQIYFQTETKYCYFFVSDERGALMFYRKNADQFLDYLARLFVFAKNAVKKVAAANPASALAASKKPVEIFHLKREPNNHCSITELDPDRDRNLMGIEKGIMPLVLSLHLLENGEMGYRFTLPDGGYSEIFSRENLHTVSRELKTLGESYRGFSFYPTDVNLENLEMKLYRENTSISFTEKNRFELMVEQGLK
jgi:adenylate cyclase